MAFRDRYPVKLAPVDPLERLFAVEAALEAGERLIPQQTVAIRLAASLLVRRTGESDELAAAVRATFEALVPARRRTPRVSVDLWVVVAAVLVERGEAPEEFASELERTLRLMRAAGIRRDPGYELIVALVLRLHSRPEPVSHEQVDRVQAVYQAMRGHHGWLTGPEDLPACAVLAMSERSPAALARHANAIYGGLRARARVWPGDSLQTASNTLAFSPLEPQELVERFVTLAAAIDSIGRSRWGLTYDEVASLCFLAQPAAGIAQTVHESTVVLSKRWSWRPDLIFTCAANLEFTRLLGEGPELAILVAVKILFDMQALMVEASTS